jgi:hypothetical protein
MSSAWHAGRALADLVVAPGSAWRQLGRGVPLRWLAVWVASLHALVCVAQTQVASSVLGRDASDWTEGARQNIALTGALGLAAVPLAIAIRAAFVVAVLGLAAPSQRRARFALALALEAITVIEAAAGTALAWAARPADVATLAGLRLHAGLDLVWQPGNAWLSALLAAANAFNAWWMMLCAAGARHMLQTGWRRALLVAFGLGSARVAWRVLWIATP